ncbi:L-threonylcarbamoyladenylate synthase type 1 TsaC [Candidatus Pantoea edessiphila]|uniref:Threonylcarbamoyl-AMP synthase n=1 Tax=Candidatus Pantoea edessiphila TaxID=2044610 RepID=A0A2P5SY27_9GAMM|nr:Sua5/YciO/YrdC/YwlC family protein [Candidatus Pantoea edessiphila]MBK4775904.1 L-threonylcarbamoyladenylate synthase type 1 TsaC [Pantoea sp. Edef]PPI87203.1 L-threonylcarbamoyladenylate synthase type 1 TsaC [Candidatus Pantoea edessiphila]
MYKKNFFSSVKKCVKELNKEGIIIYPTEAVFGLGCDPDSQIAVKKLVSLKNRSINKGFILIAENYNQLKSYIADHELSSSQRDYMLSRWPGPITFIVPTLPQTPIWLTGQFSSLAVRITDHPNVKELCNQFGKPIISTSANISNQNPCRTFKDIKKQFGNTFPVLFGKTYGYENPSEIRNIITGDLIRQG